VIIFFVRFESRVASWLQSLKLRYQLFFVFGVTILFSISMEAIVSNAGGFMGVAMGAILIRRKGGFDAQGIW